MGEQDPATHSEPVSTFHIEADHWKGISKLATVLGSRYLHTGQAILLIVFVTETWSHEKL